MQRPAPPEPSAGEIPPALPDTDLKTGLTEAEAQRLMAQHGPNAIEERHTSPLLKFLSFFWGPIPWMIETAAILSAVVRHWEDFIIIAIMLLINAGVGFWEEFKANDHHRRAQAEPGTQGPRPARR